MITKTRRIFEWLSSFTSADKAEALNLPEQWEDLFNFAVGAAALRIPPYTGEGANQAPADALDLYETLCLDDFETNW